MRRKPIATPWLRTHGMDLFILLCLVHSLSNYLPNFSVLALCLKVRVTQGSRLILLLNPRDIIEFYT